MERIESRAPPDARSRARASAPACANAPHRSSPAQDRSPPMPNRRRFRLRGRIGPRRTPGCSGSTRRTDAPARAASVGEAPMRRGSQEHDAGGPHTPGKLVRATGSAAGAARRNRLLGLWRIRINSASNQRVMNSSLTARHGHDRTAGDPAIARKRAGSPPFRPTARSAAASAPHNPGTAARTGRGPGQNRGDRSGGSGSDKNSTLRFGAQDR